MKQVYIAGPMSGLPGYNYDAFDEAAEDWQEKGWAVHNPASSFNRSLEIPYRLYMQAAIALLVQADAIAMLPGWEDSKGAKMEALIAQRLGLPFYNAETHRRMEVEDMDVEEPQVTKTGYKRRAKNHDLLEELAGLASFLAKGNRDGITTSDLRRAALANGILTGDEPPSTLSAIGHAMRRAGLVNSGMTRISDLEVTHGARQTVWMEDLTQ